MIGRLAGKLGIRGSAVFARMRNYTDVCAGADPETEPALKIKHVWRTAGGVVTIRGGRDHFEVAIAPHEWRAGSSGVCAEIRMKTTKAVDVKVFMPSLPREGVQNRFLH